MDSNARSNRYGINCVIDQLVFIAVYLFKPIVGL